MYSLGLRKDAICVRCLAPEASFLHLAWECADVYAFWVAVFNTISEMVEIEIPATPRIALLGCVEDIRATHRRLVGILLLLAKRRVAMCGGGTRVLRHSEWLRDAAFCHDLPIVFWNLMPEGSRPKDIWTPLNNFLAAQDE
ncbi:hypothetical protein NDU88_005444 [Pleurodeles waltl]|uniref:Reverse transcriptase zinc-binding domain-containing protein n=1 Tax=Pleurodeles waltl TaxID=8319 RepID=A0AAV7WBW4_PLEWA|nr:hypothetical protein NDU88_005444 [Pleurodeles waltl]